jgi:hypothetical protein
VRRLNRFFGGYKPSPEHARGTHEPEQMQGFRVSLSLPETVDKSALLPFVLNQGQQGSCVGHGVSEAIWGSLVFAARSTAVECPSPAWTYFVGRTVDGTQDKDEGTYVSSAFQGLHSVGFVSSKQLPYSDQVLVPAKNERPALTRLAYDQRLISGYARITSTGSQRVQDIKAALAAQYLVVFGTSVDQAFEDLGPDDVWLGCKGASLGGHCTVLTGYRTVNGRTQFRDRNSWGAGWCDGGSGWVDEAATAGFSDIWFVSAAPKYSGTEDT